MDNDFRQALAQSRRSSWGKINAARYHAVLNTPGKVILDVGCSKGDYVRKLSQEGYIAFGVDILADAEWQRSSQKRFVCADARHLPFQDQSFDTLLAFEVLEHIQEPGAALDEFHRICKKHLVVSVPNCNMSIDILNAGLAFSHWTDRTHLNFFTQDQLRTLLENHGFRIATITLINRAFIDYPVLRSFHIPHSIAYFISRGLARIPFRKQYFITILATAERLPK